MSEYNLVVRGGMVITGVDSFRAGVGIPAGELLNGVPGLGSRLPIVGECIRRQRLCEQPVRAHQCSLLRVGLFIIACRYI